MFPLLEDPPPNPKRPGSGPWDITGIKDGRPATSIVGVSSGGGFPLQTRGTGTRGDPTTLNKSEHGRVVWTVHIFDTFPPSETPRFGGAQNEERLPSSHLINLFGFYWPRGTWRSAFP